MATGFLTARFLKRRLWWLKLHKKFGITGTALLLTGLCLEIIHLSLIDAGHLNVLHSYIGIIIVLFSVVAPFLGFMQFKFPQNALIIKLFHRWSGRILLLLMGVNIISGLYTAGIL